MEEKRWEAVRMQNTTMLPEGYSEIFQMDLQQDKKKMLLVNGLALLITAVMLIPALFLVPIRTMFDMAAGFGIYFLRWGGLLVGIVAYMVLHELVHGVFMRHYSGVKPTYGYKGVYAYAGSTAYFNKKSYIIIALAPVVLWGIVLLILNLAAGPEGFWLIYLIQITNISGAAGDLYVTWRFSGMPQEILVQDSGVAMKVYAPKVCASKEDA
jgi:hypothetical protein